MFISARKFLFFLLVTVLFCTYGCVQVRDYTGTRDGSFVVGLNKGFDQGVESKSYYVFGEDKAIIAGDTKKDVIFKIGLPTETNAELDGYQRWVYEDKRIDLFFSGNRLRGWSRSRYEQAEIQTQR